jgi:hypothetical protein
MADSQHGWAAFTGVDKKKYPGESETWSLSQLWATADGGATWSLLMSGDNLPNMPFRMAFVSPLEGWADAVSQVPSVPTVLHTLDGGRTWTRSTLPLLAGYITVDPERDHPTEAGGHLVLSGAVNKYQLTSQVAPPWAFVSWISADGGASWTVGSSTLIGNGWMLAAFGAYIGVADEAAPTTVRLFDTHDPTSTFALDASSICSGQDASVTLVQAASSSDAWVLCRHMSRASAPPVEHDYVYATSDGGKTWRSLLGAP